MWKFFRQKKVKNYFDLLAEERAKTERKRIRDVLAKKAAEDRLRFASCPATVIAARGSGSV